MKSKKTNKYHIIETLKKKKMMQCQKNLYVRNVALINILP